MTFLENLLERPAGRSALDAFFDLESGRGVLVKVLLSISAPQTAHSPQYGTRVLRFFNKLFAAGALSQYAFRIKREKNTVDLRIF